MPSSSPQPHQALEVTDDAGLSNTAGGALLSSRKNQVLASLASASSMWLTRVSNSSASISGGNGRNPGTTKREKRKPTAVHRICCPRSRRS
jgi:hypothetical protein